MIKLSLWVSLSLCMRKIDWIGWKMGLELESCVECREQRKMMGKSSCTYYVIFTTYDGRILRTSKEFSSVKLQLFLNIHKKETKWMIVIAIAVAHHAKPKLTMTHLQFQYIFHACLVLICKLPAFSCCSQFLYPFYDQSTHSSGVSFFFTLYETVVGWITPLKDTFLLYL